LTKLRRSTKTVLFLGHLYITILKKQLKTSNHFRTSHPVWRGCASLPCDLQRHRHLAHYII